MKASLFFKDRAGSLAGLFFVLVLEALFMRVLLVSGPVIGVRSEEHTSELQSR